MAYNPKVHAIPPKPPKREKRVAIYCRVSANDTEQLNSLAVQVSALTRLVAATPQWLLVDVYMDIASSKTGTSKLYDRKCYGYDHDEDGRLIINEAEAENVRKIFKWYLDGKSILDIMNELEKQGIQSPTGKEKWPNFHMWRV